MVYPPFNWHPTIEPPIIPRGIDQYKSLPLDSPAPAAPPARAPKIVPDAQLLVSPSGTDARDSYACGCCC